MPQKVENIVITEKQLDNWETQAKDFLEKIKKLREGLDTTTREVDTVDALVAASIVVGRGCDRTGC